MSNEQTSRFIIGPVYGVDGVITMADIAVYHPYLDARGGGEAICMRTLEALQNEHELSVYSLNDPDFDVLNDQFNTKVAHVEKRSFGNRGQAIRHGGELVRRITNRPTRRLQAALSYSYVDRQNHDLIVSTYNEYGFESPSLLYIDFPNFGPQFESEPESAIESIYGTICNVAHRGTKEQVRESTLLANSEWSANIVEKVYDVRPQVLYPPVDTSGFDPRSWEKREDGFISIGRADPVKRPLKVIDIFERVRQRGHDVHLHWLGAVGDGEYGRKVQRRAAETEAVTLEGRVPFEDLAEMVSTHKYGLHGRINEHFGIAVAELLAGGTIPFVHDSGGQREIVGWSERVVYQNVQDAVSKIESILEDPDGRRIRDRLPNAKATFGLERFRRDIRAVVAQAVEDAQ